MNELNAQKRRQRKKHAHELERKRAQFIARQVTARVKGYQPKSRQIQQEMKHLGLMDKISAFSMGKKI